MKFKTAFSAADILLPKNEDMTKWAVVACDQYTSEPEYWKSVCDYVGGAKSTVKLMLPRFGLRMKTLTGKYAIFTKICPHTLNREFFQSIKTRLYMLKGLRATEKSGRVLSEK